MKWVFSVMLSIALLWCVRVPASALSVSAKGAVLLNGTSGEVLWSQNGELELSMASTTKIMTALLLCESGELERQIVTTREMVTVEGSSMGLLPGDTVSYRDLLYGMMLASGNDAANTTAIALGGSVEKFIEMMNNKAAQIGMKNTCFQTPSGLDSAGHYSTAYDMAVLARYALENEEFAAACKSQYAKLCYGNPPYYRTLKNHNKLLWNYEGLIGVKTGYTKKSGRCLVTAARRDGAYLIAVTLCAPNDWTDHKAMLDFGFSLLSDRVLLGECHSVPIAGGFAENVLVRSEDIKLSLTDGEYNSLIKKVYLPRFLYAGVALGERVGRVEYILGEKVIASAELKAQQNVEKEAAQKALYQILNNFKMLLKAMV